MLSLSGNIFGSNSEEITIFLNHDVVNDDRLVCPFPYFCFELDFSNLTAKRIEFNTYELGGDVYMETLSIFKFLKVIKWMFDEKTRSEIENEIFKHI